MTTTVVGGTPGTAPAPGVGPGVGRRRRRRTTRAEFAWIAAIALGAVVAAVLGSDAAPTGTPIVDAAYRAGAVALLVVAGSRARRWSLTIGTAVTSIAAVGPARLAAIAALLVVLGMVFLDRRSRVLDAAVAGTVGVASLHIGLGAGVLGLSTVLGLAATLPILVSAYRYTSKRARKRWRRGGVAALVVLVVATGLGAAAAVLSVDQVQSGVAATRDGVDGAAAGDEAVAADRFGAARADFRAVEARVGSWWAQSARIVPVVGVNVVAVNEAVSEAGRLTGAARSVAQAGDLESIQQLDGGVDLAALAAFEAPILGAEAAARRALANLGGSDSPWLVPQLEDRLGSLRSEVGTLADQLELAAIGITDGPALLGAEGPRRYLVLLGNPAELRDMGGHLGNWAELVADDGRLDLVEVGLPMELSRPGSEVLEETEVGVPSGLAALQPERFPQNWGGYPDLDVVGPVAAALFESATGRAVDGVLYADTAVFAALVGITGEVQVGGLERPFVLTDANAEEFLTRDQFVLYERASEADDAVADVIEEVFGDFTVTQLPSPESLADRFHPLVERGSLRMWSRHEGDDRLIDRFGLRRSLPAAEGADLLSVVQRNAGPNKIDSFLDRTTDADIRWNPSTGDVVTTVTVELQNSAPEEGFNRLVLGNDRGAPFGANVTDLAVLSPLALQSALVDGAPVAASPQWEDEYWRHTVRVAVPPGGSRVVTFRLAGQLGDASRYLLNFVGQPTMGGNEVTLRVISASAEADSVREVTRTLDGDADHVFSLAPEL